MIWLALVIGSAAQAGCPVPSTAETLNRVLDTAETAYEQMDLDAFNDHVGLIATTLACMGDILDGEHAAGVHRISALSAYHRKQPEATKKAFQSELTIRPDAALSREIAPAGNLLHDIFESARVETGGPTDPVAVPADHLLKIDGRHGNARPTSRPALLQFISAGGQVIWTHLVDVGEPMPDWFDAETEASLVAEAEEEASPPRQQWLQRRTPPSKPLLLAATGAVVTAAGLYAAALAKKRAYTDPDNGQVQTIDDLESLRRNANTMGYASIGLGATAIGLGAWAVIEVRW